MDGTKESPGHFTGRRRSRVTKRSVRLADGAARFLITSGGIGSIVAVSLVGVFLIWVVIPLFLPPSMTPQRDYPASGMQDDRTVHLDLNEYLTLAWSYHPDGFIEVRRLDTGTVLQQLQVASGDVPTACSFTPAGEQCAFGFADGSARLGRLSLATDYIEPEDLPPHLRELPLGEIAEFRQGIVERTPGEQFRLQRLELALEDPIRLSTAPIVLVDQTTRTAGPVLAAYAADDTLHLVSIAKRKNLLTGKVTATITQGRTAVAAPGDGAAPRYLLLAGIGDNVFLAWQSGRLLRYDVQSIAAPVLAEELDLTAAPDANLTSLVFQLGRASLVAGDDKGNIAVWYRIRPEQALTSDGTSLVPAVHLPAAGAAVTALGRSARTRMLTAGYADGRIRLFHVTSGQQLAEAKLPADVGPVTAIALSPRDDALLAISASSMSLWQVDAPHPEATVTSLLRPVWYEGYNQPATVWQSSSATDDFEPKYSLAPLIFGTLKATLYSMLFGLPLALLAAIYTSEFLHLRIKTRIKPVIEMMASLPSVVLGFLAALVFAPFVEKGIPQALTAFVTVPFAFLFGAHLWQLLPRSWGARLKAIKLPLMFLMLPAGLGLAIQLGKPLENLVFAGDVISWLDGQIGTGLGAWLFIMLPSSGLVAALLQDRVLNPWLRRLCRGMTRQRFAVIDLLKFLVTTAAGLGLAVALSWLMSSLGWDPRGSYIGTYVQRNALIVGFVMGFAIIPIIYTIAEDALSAVPDHLRAASYGAGATPWQTAIRVIIPPAMSGLFSAIMIGLGRAVGETMIVLMAAGNTPIMEWNIFNGFRTLSANIAVELPEAVQNSTHYRTLFLAALTLFAMTFILNTVAEAIRLRFRKKAFEL